MKLSFTAFPFLILAFSACSTLVVSTEQREIKTYENQDLANNVGTVLLFPTNTEPSANPISKIDEPLTLTFDLLGEDYQFLSAKIVHCNHDWKPSGLSDLEILRVPNQFQIEDFQYSINTIQPYTIYTLQLPTVSISGNYALVVYADNDEGNIIFTRRFVTFSNRVSLEARINYSNVPNRRQSHHQVSFDLDYGSLTLFNPLAEIRTTILQNHNWSKAINDLKPSSSRLDQNFLSYSNYNGENEFAAGNELRFADARATQFRGLNVESVTRARNGFEIRLEEDKLRSNIAYTNLFQDHNGQFSIENQNPGQDNLQADYINLHFTLASPSNLGQLFVEGKFNNWSPDSRHEMRYNDNLGRYEGQLFLKQGLYDYQYSLKTVLENTIEGDFVQTENDYEILVYYRNPKTNADEVIGYRLLSSGN